MIPDPIVEEIREIRNAHAVKYGNDLDRIVEALLEDERASSHVFVNLGPRRISAQKVSEESGSNTPASSVPAKNPAALL